ncbi:TPA: hypothetical protein NHS01_000176 [Pseudomonas aeruginosa]|nr:hypothetical protein [Pseudomonas aeruginosa]MBG3921211.1 hypothetical protein [Pseudomonas aeruginosa]MBG6852639.1 hypothetical protein [Pseudomonas aeruginosa]MBG7011838.1 hypothetical protein [Pseudomonas aeruginosa]MBG7198749.1 hypothetical protein [Pseudomonas aeruginosa]MBG7412294.1 hypothetical protein [Pseudomonas aeruginosa]
MQNDETALYEHSRGEWIATLTLTGLTLVVLVIAGYYTPAVLAAVIH